MTYEEALSMKNAIGDSYIHNGQTFIPKIAPYKESDDIKFLATIKNRNVSEEEMKSFSSDNKFKVRGFSIKTYPHIL